MYEIKAIDLFVRETPPARMSFTLGKNGSKQASEPTINPIGHVRLILAGPDGRTVFGCSGDRLSVRWLDKRAGRSTDLKRRELVQLVEKAREIYLANPKLTTPFDHWLGCYREVMKAGEQAGQEALTSSFASALMERALIDAFCRYHDKSLAQMLREEGLGFVPERVHPELKGMRLADHIPMQLTTSLYLRHTVGLSDPLVAADLPASERVNDGLPETLEEYIKTDGLRYFKVKISGDPAADVERLRRIWSVLPQTPETAITLDANEAYTDLKSFADFVRKLGDRLPGFFEHLLYIEQPLTRPLTFDPKSEQHIRTIGAMKPLLIDEADMDLDAYKKAYKLGYTGTSCKNCKGFFKSLLNRCLVAHYNAQDKPAFLSGEDLQNLPVPPLHQDFVAVSILGLTHCERNGHHYNFGLSLLSDKEKQQTVQSHPDLYHRQGDEWFLKIQNGKVETASLHGPGFGVLNEPDWESMMSMRAWVEMRHPA